MTEKYFFNREVYKHKSDMPPDVREAYDRITQIFQDKNLDGIPDLIQSNGLNGIKEVFDFVKDFSKANKSKGNFNPNQIAAIQITDSVITINGRNFNHIDDIPPEIRDVFERIVQEVDPGELVKLKGLRSDGNGYTHFSTIYKEVESPELNNIDGSTNIIQENNFTKSLILLIVAAVIALCGFGIWLVTKGILPYG